MTATLDAIVVGAGGAGAACLASLARRGLRVRGFERARVAHQDAASVSTRGFRQAYPILDATYVPLAERSRELWHELERARGEELLLATGALEIGPREHPAVAGVADSCGRHDLPYEILEAAEVAQRFPALRPGADEVAVVEKQAGILLAGAATRALVASAREAGADLDERAPVERIEADGRDVAVWARGEAWRARRVVLAPGDGLPALLAHLAPVPAWSLSVAHPQELWFGPEPIDAFRAGAMPPFSWALESGSCFAIPATREDGLKVCYRPPASGKHGGVVSDEERVRDFMHRAMPSAAAAPLRARRDCVATYTPDRHPLVGPHPADDRVLLAGGLSGHGFKLVPAIGEAIADLACDGATRHPIGALSPSRFGDGSPGA